MSLLLWSALGVFSQLSFVRLDTTMVGGTGYYANVVLLVALLANAAGFLARQLNRRVALLPLLLLIHFYLARFLGHHNLVERLPAEFQWTTVANLYPMPADFDLQLALYLLAATLAPVMLLLGAAQGEAFDASRHGWSGYLVMGLGGLVGAAFFVAQNQWLSDPVTLLALWSSALALALWRPLRVRLHRLVALAPLPLLVAGAAEYGASHLWSPYQRVSLVGRAQGVHVLSNGFYITEVSKVPRSETDPNARLWYDLALGLVVKGDRVLVLGSGGATSDVREALHRGAGQVDAVEIEKTFIELGRRFDPERSYDAPIVTVHNTDARRFLERSGETYGVVYSSFLDSQTLASNHARFRLDSFLYTLEGFRLGWKRVGPGGVLLVNFFCGNEWLRQRMYDLLRVATERDVQVVLSRLHPGGTLFIVSAARNLALPADGPFLDVSQEFRRAKPSGQLPTDDWPFFYSRGREVPMEHVRLLVGTGFLLATLLLLADRFRQPTPDASPVGGGLLLYSAFSGAAFFFMELRAIAALTPVFGSTYLAQSLVVVGIIAVSLTGSLLAAQRGLPLWISWGALLLALLLADRAAGWFHPYRGAIAPNATLFLAGLLAPAAAAGFLYLSYLKGLPVAAILELQRANILGSALGGLAECTTVLWGFRSSLGIALACYAAGLVCVEGAPRLKRLLGRRASAAL